MKLRSEGFVRTIRKWATTPGSLLHELLILAAFLAFTAVLTWPFVNYLRDAVVDTGDPYLISWVLWWDFHQTFTNPLHLFDANIFYPYRYTLAFSENSYGIAILGFPLFALGFRPLTVHAVEMFFGFALCGFAAFRLARTLTGSEAIAWIAGIIFAFVPFRFHVMSQLPYLFAPWIPLLFEALVLFVRKQSWKRAAWLGAAFFMSGLTTISWFTMSLVPAAFILIVLLTRHHLWRNRELWWRGAVSVGIGAIALAPFMVPYVIVSRLYGFKRSIDEVKLNSAWPIHWFSVENRNKLWNGMGANIPEGYKFKLFPGLLPILGSILAIASPGNRPDTNPKTSSAPPAWLWKLDLVIWITLVVSIAAVGLDGTERFYGLFLYVTSERVLTLLAVAVIARLYLAYPSFLRTINSNLRETIQSERRSDTFWIGLILTVVGFCYSLGWNFFFYRICYDLLPIFRSMRVPTRGAMFAYLGLALLAGLGVDRLARILNERRWRISRTIVFTIVGLALLFELNGAPLGLVRGEVYPDAVTLRLKATPMRGGVVVLPAGADFNHRYMLRAADHERPLITAISGFNPPYEDAIEQAIRNGNITEEFMDLLEAIPASYLVVVTKAITVDRRLDYETFLAREVREDRLRFIRRFDGDDDLYAVVKTEPQAKSEAALPFGSEAKSWSALVRDDQVNLLGRFQPWSQALSRIYFVADGKLPPYDKFVNDVAAIGNDVVIGSPDEQLKLDTKLQEFANHFAQRSQFREAYEKLTNEELVNTLFANAGIPFDQSERADLIDKLNRGEKTRGDVLWSVANNNTFIKRLEAPSLVLLHYFAYLHRNPSDPPDNNLKGFDYWVKQVAGSDDKTKLVQAFTSSFEYIKSHQKAPGQ